MKTFARRVVIAGLLFCTLGFAQQAAPAAESPFNYQEVMVPMRDGVRLQTVILTPKNQSGALPFLITRTPYGVPEKAPDSIPPSLKELADDGYIFVFQNLRGRFKSEGQWIMQRPPRDRSVPNSTDEATDAYDTIAWLLKNVQNNNGRAGMFGVSYSGWTTAMALLEPHPALKAVSEQASPADMFLGDDFHHNGAFRLSYGFEYSAMMETAKEANTHFAFDKYDTYEWYLSLGALSNVNAKYFHGSIPTWNDFVNHPNMDAFWRKQAFDSSLHRTSVPNLNVAGWWDQEDFYGPMHIYELLEKNDPDHLNYVVAGPWNHGGWMRPDGQHLGPLDFGSNVSQEFRARAMAPWFRYWLHNEGKLTEPEAMMYETGTNEWRSYDSWPPKQAKPTRLYFEADRKLSWNEPTGASGSDSYISDPADPVPYRPRPVTGTYPGPEWPVWIEQDQRFVDHRPDVLSWETEPLDHTVTIAGDVVADLIASTSGTDSDWIVKLIDVYPEDYQAPKEDGKNIGYPNGQITGGYELIIADEVFRGRFRNSFENPTPIPSNTPVEYKFSLHTNDHAFLKGHRIMVQVQSTWFPLIDRNPQKFVPNIFEAKDSDYVKATQTIFRAQGRASSVILPVLPSQ